MAIKRILWGIVLVMFIASCGAPKLLTTGKSEAVALESAGNYTQALSMWKNYFDVTAIEEVAGADFAQAAKTAYKADNNSQAISWFDQARYKDYADSEMYKILAAIYKQKDNLSKELSALEYIAENYRTEISEVNARLLEIYTEIDLNEKAIEVWSQMSADSKNAVANIDNYFKLNKKLENTEVCDSLANVLLNKNPKHIGALEWNAKKYYWDGQNRYEREMAKYNENKTRSNYNSLLKQLDLVTDDFKKALPYLDKLWELSPGKKYAAYLANIYARFGDEEKTEFYKNYMK